MTVFVNMDLPAEKNGFHSMTELINKGKIISQDLLPPLNTEEMAEINFTSGSLGRAKGVMLSQKNITENLINTSWS